MTNKFILFVFIILRAYFSFAQEPVIVVINDLDNPRASESDREIGVIIANLLRSRLGLESNIDVKKLKEVSKSDLELEKDSESDVDFIISGNYRILDDNISIYLTAFQRIDRQSYYISPKPFKIDEIFKTIDPISKELISFINRAMPAASISKSVAISCFSHSSTDKEQKDLDFIVKDLEYSVYYNMPDPFKAVTLSRSSQSCNLQELSNLNEISKKLNAEILVGSNITVEGNNFSILPTFYISEKDTSFTGSPFRTSLSDSYQFANQYSNYVNKILNSIVDSQGNWTLPESVESGSENRYRKILVEIKKRASDGQIDDYEFQTLVDQALELRPEKPDPYHYYGLIMKDINEYRKAISYFDMAISKDEKFVNAYLEKGAIQMDSERYVEALNTYKKIGNLEKKNNDVNFNLGVTYFFLDSMQYCINALEKVDLSFRREEKEYYLGNANYYLGFELYNNKDYKRALPYLEEAVKYVPDNFEFYAVLIFTEFYLGNFSQGANLLENVINEGWLSNSFYLDLAENLRSFSVGGDYSIPHLKQAVKYLHRYIEVSDNISDRSYQIMGSTFFRWGMLDSATYYYKKALNENKTYTYHYLNFAEAALMTGDYSTVESTIEAVLNLKHKTKNENGALVVAYYLLYCSNLIQGKDESEYFELLNSYINNTSFNQIWSYTTFKKWLESSEVRADIKEKIIAMTELLEG